MKLSGLSLVPSRQALSFLPEGKLLINTVNTHSFVTAQSDPLFEEALSGCDVLLPDGIGIVKAARFLSLPRAPREKIAGADLFDFEMGALERSGGGRCFFLGSSPSTLEAIRKRAAGDFPHIAVETYSPPYKDEFSDEDSRAMIEAVNASAPDLLWVGMTAPKQEKWAYRHWNQLTINCHCGCIGAVFDFYAGTVERAPKWWIDHGLEWLYRFFREPRRMFRRVFVSGTKFIFLIVKEKFSRGK